MDIQGPFSYPWTKDTTYPWTALHLSTLPMDKLELPNPPHGQRVLRIPWTTYPQDPLDNVSSGSHEQRVLRIPWTMCPQDPLDKSLIAQPLGQISLTQPMDSKKYTLGQMLLTPWIFVVYPLDKNVSPLDKNGVSSFVT